MMTRRIRYYDMATNKTEKTRPYTEEQVLALGQVNISELQSMKVAVSLSIKDIRKAVSKRLKRYRHKLQTLVFLETVNDVHEASTHILEGYYKLLTTTLTLPDDVDRWESEARFSKAHLYFAN